MNNNIIILTFSMISCGYNNEPKDMKQTNKSIFNLDEILKLFNKTDSIIAIDDYLNNKSEYGEKINRLTKPQAIFLFVENFEREVNNGGFNQFYFNSSGDFSHETVNALITIGATKTANIVKKANSRFPNSTVPKDRIKRQEILEKIENNADAVWEKCDNDFYKYEDDLVELLIEYVKQNKKDFEK